MKKIIRLTESDLTKIVKRVIKENYYDVDFATLCHWVDLLEEILDNYESIDCETKTKEYEKFYCKNLTDKTKGISSVKTMVNTTIEEAIKRLKSIKGCFDGTREYDK